MKDDLALFLMTKFESDIKDILTKLSSIDKIVTILEHKLSVINDRLDKEEQELDKLHQQKISSFLAKHWTKLPQAAVIIGGLLWFANWLYDLPSPAQEAEIKRLSESVKK